MCFLSLKILHRTLPHLSHFLAFAAFLASLSSSVNLHSFWCFLIEDILKLDPQFEQRTCLFSPCMFFMWPLKYFVQVEHRLHNAFSISFPSPLCLSMWVFRAYLLPNDFEQMLHKKFSDGLSFAVCPIMWVFRMYLLEKDFEHTLQSALSMFFPDFFSFSSFVKWAFEWASTLSLLLNIFPHVSQGCDATMIVGSFLSSLSFSMWFVKLSPFFVVKISFLPIFLSWAHSLIWMIFTSTGSSSDLRSETPWKPRSKANSDSFGFKPLPFRTEAKRFLRGGNVKCCGKLEHYSTLVELLSRGGLWLGGIQLVPGAWQGAGWGLRGDVAAPAIRKYFEERKRRKNGENLKSPSIVGEERAWGKLGGDRSQVWEKILITCHSNGRYLKKKKRIDKM